MDKRKTTLDRFQVAVNQLCHAYDIALSDVYVTGKHAELFHGHRTLAEGVHISLPFDRFLEVRDAAGYSDNALEFKEYGVSVHQWPKDRRSMFMSVDGYSVETELQLLVDQVRTGIIFPSVIGKRLKAAKDKMGSIDGNFNAKREYYAGILLNCHPESPESANVISAWYMAVFAGSTMDLVRLVRDFDSALAIPTEAPANELETIAKAPPFKTPKAISPGVTLPTKVLDKKEKKAKITADANALAARVIEWSAGIRAMLEVVPNRRGYPPFTLGAMFAHDARDGSINLRTLMDVSIVTAGDLAEALVGSDTSQESMSIEMFDDIVSEFSDGYSAGYKAECF